VFALLLALLLPAAFLPAAAATVGVLPLPEHDAQCLLRNKEP
jgi:hypothetical protein